MTQLTPIEAAPRRPLDVLTEGAITLARDVVDVAGFLDGVDSQAKAQAATLQAAETAARQVVTNAEEMISAATGLAKAIGTMAEATTAATDQLGTAMGTSRRVLDWVGNLGAKLSSVDEAADKASDANVRILHIAREVNILAINAKIEAARRGLGPRLRRGGRCDQRALGPDGRIGQPDLADDRGARP